MRTITLAAFAAALALSACSEKTKDNAAETATSAGQDISTAATDTREATSTGAARIGAKADAAMDRAEEAADRMGKRIKQGADEAKDALKPTPVPTPSPTRSPQ